MAENNNTVPYIVYEGTLDRLDRRHRWDMIIIIILIVLLAASNMAWLWFFNQYEIVDDYSIEAEQDGSGVNIVGGGDIDYGTEGENNEIEADGSQK